MLTNNFQYKEVTSEIFQTFKPNSSLLKKYIDRFYFHKDDNPENSKKIVYFPNTKNALTIYKNAEHKIIKKSPFHIKIFPSNESNYAFFFGGIQQNYVIYETYTPFNEIGVIFHPLGMNHFIDEPYLGRTLQSNYNFAPIEKKLTPYIDSIYAEESFELKQEILENFFLSQLNHDYNEPILEEALSLIEEFKGELKVSQLAEELDIEEKTLMSKFRNHLNCTPKYFSKVYQFRIALSKYNTNKNRKILTDLADNKHYYDKIDFVKNFKYLTSKKPSIFFRQIIDLGNDMYWFK